MVESKSTISFSVALPQAITYMIATPNSEHSVYGLIANGDEFMLIKILTQETPKYDLSNFFSLILPRKNQFYDILCILKKIANVIS